MAKCGNSRFESAGKENKRKSGQAEQSELTYISDTRKTLLRNWKLLRVSAAKQFPFKSSGLIGNLQGDLQIADF